MKPEGRVKLATRLPAWRAVPLAAMVCVAVALALPAPALAVWSSPSQIVGFLGKGVVASIDEDGTEQLGVVADLAPVLDGGAGLYNLTREPGATGWMTTRVAPYVNDARFAFAANGAGLVTWQGAPEGGKPTVWAAYRQAGKTWSPPTKLDNPITVSRGPLPAISDSGAAVVVWMRKSSAGLLGPDQIVYSATSNGSWPALPSSLAAVSLPDPQIPSSSGGFAFANCGPSALRAAVLPDGTPIAAWDDPYGSFKQHAEDLVPPIESDDQEWGLCGVKVATPASTVGVTPRPAIGWGLTPSGPRPHWTLRGFEIDPVTGETALVVRGSDNALTDSDTICNVLGTADLDYCFNGGATETQVSLGNGTGLGHPGTTVFGNALTALRGGFVALASRDPNPLAAGVGATLPALSPLSNNEPLTAADLAVGAHGEAQLVTHDGSTLQAFTALAGGSFSAGVEIQSGSQGSLSVAIGCNGDALLGWDRNGPIFTAVNRSGTAPCSPGPGPGGEEPDDPEDPGPGGEDPGQPGGGTPTTTGPANPSSATGTSPGVPTTTTPASSAKTPPKKCKKGFKRTTVRGKAKCVKVKPKGKR